MLHMPKNSDGFNVEARGSQLKPNESLGPEVHTIFTT
jgi:hypothetical protein